MALSTDLHAAPYFNDYDEDKNYHQILFKPSIAVQARELSQLQTILQNQVERFGDNILVRGTIVKGGNFYDYRKLPYVKIEDNTINGNPVNLKNYSGATLRGVNSGVTAVVITTLDGTSNNSPNLNTLYVKYTQSGVDSSGKDIKTFVTGETLEVTVGGVIQPDISVSVVPLSIDRNPVGNGYAVSCGDGIIYQKGFFVRFENQITVISRYNTVPDDIVVGFITEEEIVTALEDTTLYNNAAGFYNQNTSGADRIKLTPKLIYYTKEEAENDENFLSIQEYQEGRLVRRNSETKFNSFTKELEKRTYEESGNYVVNGMNVDVEIPTEDPTKLDLSISSGIAYVNGKRSQTLSKYTMDLPKSTDFETVMNQDVLANYGNFVYLDSLVGSFPYENMSVVSLRGSTQSATSMIGFNAIGGVIGQARVLSYDKESDGRYRVYLFDVKMHNNNIFSATKSITSTTGFGNLILESGKAVIKDSNFKSLVFPLGHDFVKEIITTNTDYVYRKTSTMSVGLSGSMNLSAGSDESFPYTASSSLNSDAIRDIIVTDTTSGVVYPVLSAVVDATGTAMTIELGIRQTTTDVSVIFNVKRKNVRPTGKVLRTVYMRIDASNGHTSGTYYLGWPDVVSIEGIWRGTTNTFTESTSGVSNVTSNFSLYKNINDTYYGISYIKNKTSFNIAQTDRFLVKAKVFVKDTSGSFSQSFFCVNSYPIDDTSEILPVDRIRTENIPNGMRDVIDFRQYADNRAAYATSPSSATINNTSATLSALTFSGNSFMIAPNRIVETSYSYYLSRRDILVVDETGEYALITGETSTNPTYPPEPPKTMTIAKIYVPAFPSLPPSIATKTGYPEYAIKVFKENNKRYTMQDITAIESRLDNIEYYTILNTLEKSAEDMVIKDSDGLNRFKNGIFVDNFENMLACEVKTPDFSASVDAGESALYPKFRAYNLELGNPTVNGGVVLNNNSVTTMGYKWVPMERQLYATKYRNCVTDFYNFTGVGVIFPEYDNGYDETYAPDVNITVDMVGAFAEFTESLGEIVPLTVKNTKTTTSNKNMGSTSSTAVSASTSGRTTTTTTTTTTTNKKLVTTTNITNTSKLVAGKASTSTQEVGDFITNISISPYLRANVIRVAFAGLRPNTRFWAWFDGKPITQRCAMAREKVGSDLVKDLIRTTKWGEPLRSNANGELMFMIDLPGQTFYVGDRDIVVMDVDSIESDEAATSSGVVTYSGFNYSVNKTGLEVSTRTPNYDIAKSRAVSVDKKIVTTQSVTSTSTSVTTPAVRPPNRGLFGGGDGSKDPIAQTFFVDPSYTKGDSVMVLGVSVAFKKKDATKGVTVQLRKTSNGYPSSEVLAFGSVRKKSSEVLVSNNGSAMTIFQFKAPIALAAGESYAIVVIPDGNSPDYQVFCAETGQSDLRTGAQITSDVNRGTLFTSTNNMAWTPYQAENMTFIVHKAEINDTSGNIYMSLNNYEFFDLSTYSGNFRRGETAFANRANAAGSISTTNGSNVVTGTGTTFTTTFAVGDHVAIFNSADGSYDVSRISSITNNTSMVLDEVMKDTRTGRTYFKTVVGVVDYFNTKTPARLFLKESSAKSGNVFAAGDLIRGEVSGSTATVQMLTLLPVSHYQANIHRTNFNNTSTNLFIDRQTELRANGTTNLSTTDRAQLYGDNNRLGNFNTVIKSRSSEIVENGGARSFSLRVNLNITGTIPQYISPVVDYEVSGITVFEYAINTYSPSLETSEKFDGGDAMSKYISKKVTLRDGFDAEDLKVWLTAYRPIGSEINVFVKYISEIDNTPLTEMPWTKMKLVESKNFRSSSTNLEDFKEIEFELDTLALGNKGGAFLENGQFKYLGENGEVYDNFKHFIIKIVLSSTGQHIIPKVKDIRAIALT